MFQDCEVSSPYNTVKFLSFNDFVLKTFVPSENMFKKLHRGSVVPYIIVKNGLNLQIHIYVYILNFEELIIFNPVIISAQSLYQW